MNVENDDNVGRDKREGKYKINKIISLTTNSLFIHTSSSHHAKLSPMSELCCPHALLSLGPRVFCGVPSLRPGPFWSCAPRVRFCQREQKEMFAF